MNANQLLHPLVSSAIKEFGIKAEVRECAPDLADTTQFCAHYGFPLEVCGNTIIIVGKSNPKVYAACVGLAHTRLDVNHTIRTLLEVRKTSFASADATKELTGMEIGGVTVLGLPQSLPIFADSRLLDKEYLVLGSGTRLSKLLVHPAELRKIPHLEFVEGLSVA